MSEAPEKTHVVYKTVHGLNVKRGDRILLTLSSAPGPDESRMMLAALRERFPGVEFTLVGNVTGLVRVES